MLFLLFVANDLHSLDNELVAHIYMAHDNESGLNFVIYSFNNMDLVNVQCYTCSSNCSAEVT